MGKVISKITRKINRFNVESRAHRVLERDKPTPAPKFESNIRDMQRALDLDPKLLEKLNKKDSYLDDRLKNVYVTSKDSGIIDYGLQGRDVDGRPLPLNKSTVDDFEFGYKEPMRVSTGRCTLRQAIQFIADHQRDPELWTKKKVADEYKIKENVVGNILHYFKTFQMYVPDIKRKENILTQAKNKMLRGKDEPT